MGARPDGGELQDLRRRRFRRQCHPHRREPPRALCRRQSGDADALYSWKRGGTIRDIIDALTPQDHVVLVGHSYGADTACSVVTDTARAVDVLVSIDPVGHFRPAWTAIRAKARRWLNVRAQPDDSRWSNDDRIAWVGGKYPLPPARGQAGAPASRSSPTRRTAPSAR